MVPLNEITSHLLVTLVYFLLISVLKWKFDIGYLWLWLGALAGTFFLDIDHLLYWFVTHPEEEDSKEARGLWGLRDLGDLRVMGIIGRLKGLYLLGQKYHNSHHRLIFHSVVGQAVLLVLALYILSSGGSIFASAFVLSINLHLLKDEWQDYFRNKQGLIDWLFWLVRGVPTGEYLNVYLGGVSLLFLALTLFF